MTSEQATIVANGQEVESAGSAVIIGTGIPVSATNNSELAAFISGLDYAYLNAPTSRAAALQIINREADADDAARFFRPSLTAEAATFNDGVTLIATQPLIDFGKRAARVATINAQTDQERFRLAQEHQLLLRSALFAVIDAKHAGRLATLYEDQITAFAQARDQALRLANINLLTDADVRLAEVELKQGQVDLATANINRARAARVWEQVTDRATAPPNFDVESLQNLAEVSTLGAARQVALSRNLDLREIAVTDTNLRAQETTFSRASSPTINASIQANLNDEENVAQAGLTLSFDIIDPDARADLQSTQRDRMGLLAQSTALRDTLTYELERLTLQIDDARRLMTIQQESLALLQARVIDLERLLETGLSSYSDVIAARSDQYDTALSIEENRYLVDVSIAEIILLTGVLVP